MVLRLTKIKNTSERNVATIDWTWHSQMWYKIVSHLWTSSAAFLPYNTAHRSIVALLNALQQRNPSVSNTSWILSAPKQWHASDRDCKGISFAAKLKVSNQRQWQDARLKSTHVLMHDARLKSKGITEKIRETTIRTGFAASLIGFAMQTTKRFRSKYQLKNYFLMTDRKGFRRPIRCHMLQASYSRRRGKS